MVRYNVVLLQQIKKSKNMKNQFLMAALLICSIGIAQVKSQSKTASKPLQYGLKLGINSAKLTNSDGGVTASPRIGINMGSFLNYRFTEKFAFQPELLYTTQGIINKGTVEGTSIKITYKLDYIALPLMMKFYPAKDFNLEFGPQVGFNVKKELEVKANGQSQSFDLDDFFSSNGIEAKTNTVDFALNFGLGYEIANGLSLNGRYTLGLTKVFEGADVVDENGNVQKVKNSVFTFGLGYTFK